MLKNILLLEIFSLEGAGGSVHRGSDGGNSGEGGNSAVGGGGNSWGQQWGSWTSKNRSSHHNYKSLKQFELKKELKGSKST